MANPRMPSRPKKAWPFRIEFPPELPISARADEIIGLSALLTTTMPYMKVVIDALQDQPELAAMKIAVGGAPVNRMFADEISADGYGPDASSSVEMFLGFISAAREAAAHPSGLT